METSIKIEKAIFEEMNQHLENGINKEYLETADLEEDSTLLMERAKFDNGYEVSLEVFTGTESVMSTAYLFDETGECVEYIETDTGIDTCYEFKDGEYCLNIEVI